MVVIPKTLSDHPSLVGVVRFPTCATTTEEVKIPLIVKTESGKFQNMLQVVDMATTINPVVISKGYGSIPKAKITDFYPYTYYVLTDGESEPLIMLPQHMPNNVIVNGAFALSHQPIEKYWVVGYKGDDNGQVYNITNVNQMMLPTATNEGMNFLQANANSIAQTRKTQIQGNVINAVQTGVSAIATGGMSLLLGGIGQTLNGLNEIKNIDSRNKDTMLTPNSISSFGTPSTRKAFATDNVRIQKYQVNDNIITKINNYVSRYGNKYNNYDTINLTTYKGYIKYISPNIDTKIDNMYVSKIISILERGIYFD